MKGGLAGSKHWRSVIRKSLEKDHSSAPPKAVTAGGFAFQLRAEIAVVFGFPGPSMIGMEPFIIIFIKSTRPVR